METKHSDALLCVILYSWEYSHLQFGLFFNHETLLAADLLEASETEVDTLIEKIKDKARSIANPLDATLEFLELDDGCLEAAQWEISDMGPPSSESLLEFASLQRADQPLADDAAAISFSVDQPNAQLHGTAFRLAGGLGLTQLLPSGDESYAGGAPLEPEKDPDFVVVTHMRTGDAIVVSRWRILGEEAMNELLALAIDWTALKPLSQLPTATADEVVALQARYDERERQLLAKRTTILLASTKWSATAPPVALTNMPSERLVEVLRQRSDVLLLAAWLTGPITPGGLAAVRAEIVAIVSETYKPEALEFEVDQLNQLCWEYHDRDLTAADIANLREEYKKALERLKTKMENLTTLVHQERRDRPDAWSREKIIERIIVLVSEYQQDVSQLLLSIIRYSF